MPYKGVYHSIFCGVGGNSIVEKLCFHPSNSQNLDSFQIYDSFFCRTFLATIISFTWTPPKNILKILQPPVENEWSAPNYILYGNQPWIEDCRSKETDFHAELVVHVSCCKWRLGQQKRSATDNALTVMLTHTHTHTDRQTDRDRERQRERQRETEREMDRQTETDRQRQTEKFRKQKDERVNLPREIRISDTVTVDEYEWCPWARTMHETL